MRTETGAAGAADSSDELLVHDATNASRSASVRIWAAAIAIGVLTFGYRFLSFESFTNDHFVHLARAQQWLAGEWPSRDFVDPGMPLAIGLSAVAQVLFGHGLRAELIFIAFAFALSSTLLMVVAARLSGSWAIAICAVLIAVLIYPRSYNYPKLLPYSAALLAGHWYGTKPALPRLFGLALITAAAFLLRHDHGVLIGFATVVALVAAHRDVRDALTRIAVLVAVVLVASLPYLAWVQIHEGLVTHARDGLAYSGREAGKGSWRPPGFHLDRSRPLWAIDRQGSSHAFPQINVRWAADVDDAARARLEARHGLDPLRPNGLRTWEYEIHDWSASALRALIAERGVEDTQGIDREKAELTQPIPLGAWMPAWLRGAPGEGLHFEHNLAALLFYLVWTLAIVSTVALMRSWRRLSRPQRTSGAMFIALQVAMNLTMLRDPIEVHISYVLAPTAVMVAWLWRQAALSSAAPKLRPAMAAMIAVVLVSAAGVGEAGKCLRLTGVMAGLPGLERRVRELHDEFVPPRHMAGRHRADPIVSYLVECMPAQSRLFAMAFTPELFFYTGHLFAGGQAMLVPGFFGPRHDALMLSRLRSEDVPFVIIDSQFERSFAGDFPGVMGYVRGRYREALRFDDGKTPPGQVLILLADTMRTISRRYAGGPCFTGQDAHD